MLNPEIKKLILTRINEELIGTPYFDNNFNPVLFFNLLEEMEQSVESGTVGDLANPAAALSAWVWERLSGPLTPDEQSVRYYVIKMLFNLHTEINKRLSRVESGAV